MLVFSFSFYLSLFEALPSIASEACQMLPLYTSKTAFIPLKEGGMEGGGGRRGKDGDKRIKDESVGLVACGA